MSLLRSSLCLLSGLLYVFSFAPWDQGYLQWVAFFPLLLAVQGVEKKRSIFLFGFILSLCICIGGFYWIIYATRQYGDLSLPLALALFAAFCVIGQLQVPLYLLFRSAILKTDFFKKNRWCWILASGFIYAGIESLYPKLFLDTAGNAFSRSLYFRQAADLGGPFLLTVLILTVNELWLAAYLEQKIIRLALRPLVMAVAMIACVCAYGVFRVKQIHTLQNTNSTRPKLLVSMIQANIGDFLKVQSERGLVTATQQVMGKYLSLSELAARALPKPDVILWPETAYPAIFEKSITVPEHAMEMNLKNFAQAYGGTLLFGGYDQDMTQTDYNTLFFWDARNQSKQFYHKAILLMFGETLPFAELYPPMKNWFPTMGFFGRGPGAQVLEVKSLAGVPFHLAPSICYEGLFPSHSAEGALFGADALVNVTNDSWFGPAGEPDLHLALTVFRSIETRLPMLRSTNTGFTTVIDETGEITQSSALGHTEVVTGEIAKKLPIFSPHLFMSKIFGGNWFAQFCQLILLVLGLTLFAQKRKNLNPVP